MKGFVLTLENQHQSRQARGSNGGLFSKVVGESGDCLRMLISVNQHVTHEICSMRHPGLQASHSNNANDRGVGVELVYYTRFKRVRLSVFRFSDN
jgi:hypothetical protein